MQLSSKRAAAASQVRLSAGWACGFFILVRVPQGQHCTLGVAALGLAVLPQPIAFQVVDHLGR